MMALALEEARHAVAAGSAGVAALLLWHDEIPAQGHNRIPETGDLTDHAEMIVLRDAASRLSTMSYAEHNSLCMYVTLEPCLMCFAALSFVGVRRVVCSALIEDANEESLIARDLTCGEVNPLLTRGPMILVEGMQRDEGRELLAMMGILAQSS